MINPTRRELAIGAGALALAACTRQQPLQFTPPRSRQFPADFLWGCATAAFQIEGATREDGRGESVWDVFQRQPGKIADDSTADTADDSYHRYADDVALLADFGAKAYRFSISWPRIQPDGAGAINDKGVDYYSRLADALLARNIVPYATLFHWDLPQALFTKGGWYNRDTAQRLADYAGIVAQRLGDRVKHIIVLNEAAPHAILGHVLGQHAPGLTDADKLGLVIHHQNLAQGLALQALRAARGDLTLGTTLALQPALAASGLLSLLNGAAADGFDDIWNRAFLDPLLLGSYPKRVSDMIGAALRDGDLAITKQPIDFVGVNYYAPTYIRFDLSSPSKIAAADPPEGAARDAFNREIDPAGLAEVLARLRGDYGNPRIIVTENGCSDPLSTGPAQMDDQFRVAYLREHLEAVKSAMEAGSPIGGFLIWSLIDNWEWAFGFTSKFGLCAVDRATLARTPKTSFAWFKQLAASGVLDEASR
ncbi:MAG: GH1 family beta-glucosidase [Alphaproteobacteria bacterium]